MPTPPPPASREDASLEARIRLKLNAGEKLDEAERQYLSRLPDHDVRYQ